MNKRIDTKAVLATALVYKGIKGADWVVQSILVDVNRLRVGLAQEIADCARLRTELRDMTERYEHAREHGKDCRCIECRVPGD